MAQRKRNIEFSKPDEPSFLKKFKSKISGLNLAADTVETKKASLSAVTEGDLEDREDEQPIYVISEDSDISESELQQFKCKLQNDHSELQTDSKEPQKIVFKKPDKEKSESKTMQTYKNTKKQGLVTVLQQQANSKTSTQSVKNTNLLSFDEGDENEED